MRLTIIGAGPGGYETAVAAAKSGIETVIISDGHVGGTCLNEGCIPTKSFCRNAEVMDDFANAETFGIGDLSYKFDFNKVLKRKNSVVAQLRSGVEGLLKHKNITLIRGNAAFKDAHTVRISSDNSETDGQEISSDYFIIATGSHSATLPIPGNDLDGVITSKEILDIEDVPKRLCVIGAGVIGLEFASIFRSFGSEVNVVEYCKDILPRFDTDLAKRLKQALGKRGIGIETGAQVQSIERDGDSLVVTYLKKDKEFRIEADKVLMAVGRRPNISSAALDAAGVEYGPRGVVVDADMRTNVPHIFAIGDITGGMMLAHVASFQGRLALKAILSESGMCCCDDEARIRLDIVPAAVFTKPEAATVGKTEDECKNASIPVKCLKSFFRANGKALSMDEPEGFCKLVVAEGSEAYAPGQILGCHLFGAHSADLIQEVASLMNHNATVAELAATVHAHPTLGEVIMDAAHSATIA